MDDSSPPGEHGDGMPEGMMMMKQEEEGKENHCEELNNSAVSVAGSASSGATQGSVKNYKTTLCQFYLQVRRKHVTAFQRNVSRIQTLNEIYSSSTRVRARTATPATTPTAPPSFGPPRAGPSRTWSRPWSARRRSRPSCARSSSSSGCAPSATTAPTPTESGSCRRPSPRSEARRAPTHPSRRRYAGSSSSPPSTTPTHFIYLAKARTDLPQMTCVWFATFWRSLKF